MVGGEHKLDTVHAGEYEIGEEAMDDDDMGEDDD
jgi:hypothetical protein